MVELGIHTTWPLVLDMWFFRTTIEDAIAKVPVRDTACPATRDLLDCQSSRSRVQLMNMGGTSEILGAEASALAKLPAGITLRLTASYTWGEGPSTNFAVDPNATSQGHSREPLSRVPPFNGSVELAWRPTAALTLGAAGRWARTQDRLALSDTYDARIPAGGTPGYGVAELRATYRVDNSFVASLVLDNVFDAAYRHHGSSVNGAARGLMLMVDASTALWGG